MAPDALVLFQFACLVDDLEAAAERWATSLGAGPFFVTPHHRADLFGYSGATQIQLIQRHDGTGSALRHHVSGT